MINFKEETLEILGQYGKTIDDIKWIGDNAGERTTDIQEFFDRIDFSYNDGSGCGFIRQSLVIVGDNWWLERGEYDVYEWGNFKTIPKLSESAVKVEPRELY